jgi:hypothetical protein
MRYIITATAILLLQAACGGGRQYGTAEFGPLVLEGEVDPEYLLLQLNQLDPTFEACYVRALRGNRATEGVIRIRLAGGQGRLDPEILANETGSEELEECVENAIAQLTIVEPPRSDPWDFTGEWSVEFAIIRRQ